MPDYSRDDLRRLAAIDSTERVECWSCPDCAFTFDATHTDTAGGYTCPACEELRLEADLTVAVHEATRARAEARSEKATNAELRRQLAGTGALLGKAEGTLAEVRKRLFQGGQSPAIRCQQAIFALDAGAGATGTESEP